MSFGVPYQYPNQYPNYTQPLMDNLAQMRSQFIPQPPVPQNVSQNNNGMIWVQGEAGAKSYLVAAGNTVPLWDSENPVVYIKSVDASGMPSMRIIDYTERSQPQKAAVVSPTVDYVTRAEFDELAAQIQTLMTKRGRKAASEEASNE